MRGATMRASDRAYESIRDDILSWRLRPGTALAETDLADSLGISRTPVREALGRLAADGLVRASGRYDVVTELSVDSLGELFEYREALETKAAQLAARHCTSNAQDAELFAELREGFAGADRLLRGSDREHEEYYALVARFDAAVDAAIDNLYLLAALRGVRTHLARARRLAKDNPQRLAQAAVEHLAIVQAIVDGDELMAVHATSVHLRASLTNVLATVAANATVAAHDLHIAEDGSLRDRAPQERQAQ
jgi:DNA-binding GntR family transcriptional regulator